MASKKTPALSTQVKTLQAELEKVKADLKSKTEYYERERKEKHLLIEELSQLHGLLDAMPNAAPRKTIGKSEWNTEIEIENKAMTRLAAWLSCRALS